MDERLKFVARLLDGEKMAVLCREFDISRKTGYKIFARYKDCGLEGLTDRSRQPYRHGLRLPFQIEKLIVQLKQEHPSWGAPKIREKIVCNDMWRRSSAARGHSRTGAAVALGASDRDRHRAWPQRLRFNRIFSPDVVERNSMICGYCFAQAIR
jgi:hypothetical protein